MTCHIHPGTNMVATYFGYTWWDNESDGAAMYPAAQRHPSEDERYDVSQRNPEGAAVRGMWADVNVLSRTGSPEFNAKLKQTQFADFHGHGWLFRAVYARDRKGNLLDANGGIVPFDDPDKFGKAVHLEDIHLEKGMQCVDCHFEQDAHGSGKLFGEPRAAIELDCVDCHGTIEQRATLLTSGPAAPPGGTHLDALRTPWGQRRFEWRDGRLYQRSMMDPHQEWEVVQTLDSITPGNPHYNEKSRLAKTLRVDGKTWGDVPPDPAMLAHANSRMACYTCHTAWTPNCFGCHLQMTANQRRPMLHNEGLLTRNWTSYNFQVLRDDGYMLGVDGTVTGHRIAPARSSCAVLVSSQNANREWLYYTQQTISAEGFSGEAFSTFVPHTVRARETKGCTDCHVSAARDNNAWMAMLLLQGTNFVNFMGRYVYVADGAKGFQAVVTAEHDEPEAVFGSDLQRMAYPDDYKEHVARAGRLTTALRHAGNVLDVQLRGEYLYAAMGRDGFRIYRRREHRQQRFFGAHDDGAGFADGAAPLRQDKVRDGGGDADDARRRSAPFAPSRERRAEDSPDVWFSLRDGSRRRARRRRQSRSEIEKSGRRHAAERQSRRQFHRPRRDIQSEWNFERRAAHHDCRNICLHPVRSRARRSGPGQSAAAARHGGNRRARSR